MPKLGYSFEISDWNPCSVTCGGGSQDRTVSGQKKRPIPVMEILEDAQMTGGESWEKRLCRGCFVNWG